MQFSCLVTVVIQLSFSHFEQQDEYEFWIWFCVNLVVFSIMWQLSFHHADVYCIANTVVYKLALHPVVENFTGDIFWEVSGNGVFDFRRTVVAFLCRKMRHSLNLFPLGNYLGNCDFYILSPFPSSSSEKQPHNLKFLFSFTSVLI